MKSLLKYQWCFSKNRKNNFKTCIEIQKISYSQSNLEKEESWRHHTSLTSDYATKLHQLKQYHTSPKINPHTYSQSMCDRQGKNTQQRKGSLSHNQCWENWTATGSRMKLEPSLTLHSKINSKWIKDLNVRLDTINLLEKNIDRTF